MRRNYLYPMLQALFAALLFGASAPAAKVLLGEIEPVSLAAFLYLGSGLALLSIRAVQGLAGTRHRAEAPISRADYPWLAGAILAGGVAAPIVLMVSLGHTSASVASLLLNFEGVATMLIAIVVFKEAIGRRAGWAVGCISLASILLSWDPRSAWSVSLGALGVVAACVLWGVDNNLTRNISAKDPLSIVMIKGLAAGTFSLCLALALGDRLPAAGVVARAMLLGSLSYGLSIVLFVRALRSLGAVRTSALFGTAPLVGVVLSFLLFHELPGGAFWAALLLMAAGAILLLNEQHEHRHIHVAVAHEHRHTHEDGHHRHDHQDTAYRGSHSHLHHHPRAEHMHGHLPDIHHRHSHPAEM